MSHHENRIADLHRTIAPLQVTSTDIDAVKGSMLEEVTFHKVEGDGNPTRLYAVGERNVAGAHDRFCVTGLYLQHEGCQGALPIEGLDFQHGNPLTNGYNGVTIEQVLAMGKHRLEGYQSGPFACADNQEAIDHITQAIEALQRRTKDRIAREVKNTNEA